MRILILLGRIIIGIVFIFSGTVKAIDPLGTAYKFQDYFTAFNLDFLKNFGLLFALVLCTCEFIAGISILFNIRQKTGIWIVLIMMIIFTPLTFVLALTNPVTDCGCFGDAIHLTNWQTFAKNIILLIPAVVLFTRRKEIEPVRSSTKEWIIISITGLFFLSFAAYNLRYLPVIDFLPYKTGTFIPDKMIIPEGRPPDKYETTFIYEKEGVKKVFSLENYPEGDSTWKFVDQQSVLVSKGYEPPIHDFFITTLNNEDITDQILSSKDFIVLMISKRLSEADPEELLKGFEVGHHCQKNQIGFYVLTASGAEEINNYNDSLVFCQVDEITLKTIVRTNPGYILLKEGTVKAKWSWANFPEQDEIIEIITREHSN